MATTPRRTLIRRAASVSAIAIAVSVLGVGSPVASAAPVKAAGIPALGSAAALAAVKDAAATGYTLPAKFGANCGSQG